MSSDTRRCPNTTKDCRDQKTELIRLLAAAQEDRDEWKRQHENLLSVRQSDLTALTTKTAELEACRADVERLRSAATLGLDAKNATINELTAELAACKRDAALLADWEKLKDPVTLHQNLLRGFPAQLTPDMLKHLLGEHEIAKVKREGAREALTTAADRFNRLWKTLSGQTVAQELCRMIATLDQPTDQQKEG